MEKLGVSHVGERVMLMNLAKANESTSIPRMRKHVIIIDLYKQLKSRKKGVARRKSYKVTSSTVQNGLVFVAITPFDASGYTND